MRKLTIKKDKKFGRWTIIKEVEPRIKKKRARRQVLVICDCGNIKKILYESLTSSRGTRSCGCLSIEKTILRNKQNATHKMSNTKFYNTWYRILARCNNKRNNRWYCYGGRGIKCEWKNFEEFKNDMLTSYWKHCKKFGKKQTTIDRINVNKNYCKENCRWATYKEQMNNTRINHFITYGKETLTIKQWSEKTNINYGTLCSRINKSHWSIEKALLTK